MQIVDFGVARLISADGSHASIDAIGEVSGSRPLSHMPPFSSHFLLMCFTRFDHSPRDSPPALLKRHFWRAEWNRRIVSCVQSLTEAFKVTVLLVLHTFGGDAVRASLCSIIASPRLRHLATRRSDQRGRCVQLAILLLELLSGEATLWGQRPPSN